MNPLLEVHNLVKHFGPVRAVDGVSLTVQEGETLALVGESGCGKSTTGRCLLRLIEPDAGEVLFDGHNVLQLKGSAVRGLRRNLQIIFQDPFTSLNPRMTIGQAIAEPLWIHQLCSRAELKGRVADLLAMVGLRPEYAGHYPHEFSGGQRQRVVIARALSVKPSLIVADEPVSSLDVSVQAQILNMLLDLQEKLGVAYLFISHNLNVVRQIAHRTAVMYLGKIVETAPTQELFKDPRHPYTRALLSAIPVPDPSRQRSRIELRGEPPSPRDLPPGCRFHPRCAHAVDRCLNVEPNLEPCGPNHEAACHLRLELPHFDCP